MARKSTQWRNRARRVAQGSRCGQACSRWRHWRGRRPRAAIHPRAIADLHARGHERHPHQVGARPLPHARLLALQEDPALGRSDLPARHADPLRHRGLSREMRDQDGHRPARQAADGARHPGLCDRHVLRRAVLRGEDRAGPRRHHGGLGHLLGRRRHDPRRAALFDQVVLSVHPVALRLQPAPSAPCRCLRILHRPGLQGRPRRPSDGPEGDRPGGRDALAARRHRPALAGPPSRLARSRRSGAQDPGNPRGDQLGNPDPAQARRRARL